MQTILFILHRNSSLNLDVFFPRNGHLVWVDILRSKDLVRVSFVPAISFVLLGQRVKLMVGCARNLGRFGPTISEQKHRRVIRRPGKQFLLPGPFGTDLCFRLVTPGIICSKHLTSVKMGKGFSRCEEEFSVIANPV